MATTGSAIKNPDFITFLSKTYGTGDIVIDFMIVGGGFLLFMAIIGIMQAMGYGKFSSDRETELLNEVSELLNEMHVQINELRSAIIQEFERYRGELGYLRQDLKELELTLSSPSRRRVMDEIDFTESADEVTLRDFFGLRSGSDNYPIV